MSLNFADYKRLEIPEGKVKQIARKSDGLVLWEAGYVNMVPLSINSDGTIYNGTGYKDGYRLRSGGAEASQSTASCTGYIPASAGDVVRIAGVNFSSDTNSNAINISDADFTNLGQMAMNSTYGYGTIAGTSYGSKASVAEESDGVWKWVVPPVDYGETAYIRVTGYTNGASGSNLIVTINEEIA